MRAWWRAIGAGFLVFGVAGCGVSGGDSEQVKPSSTSTSTTAAPGRDDGLIAFEQGTFDKDERLAFLDPASDRVTPVPGGEFGYYARFAPDGSKLVWAQMKSASEGTDAILVHDLSTGKTRRYSQKGGCPTFSPDGKSVVISGEAARRIDLDSGNAEDLPGPSEGCRIEMKDGRFLHTRHDDKVQIIDGDAVTAIYEAPGCWIDTPSLSPGGSKVAFVQWCEAKNMYDLMVMEVDGSNARSVVDVATYGTGWSPDGRSIVTAQRNPTERVTSLWTFGVDGSRSSFKEVQPGPANTPTWGPTAPSD